MKNEIITNIPVKGELYFGVEIECLLKEKYLTGYLTRLKDVYGTIVTGKHDGTVSDNIGQSLKDVHEHISATELVISPMTIDCYKNRTWGKIFDSVIKPNYYYTSTLGGHIHMSMSAFQNRLHLYKYMKFIRTNIEYIKFIGERDFTSNSYCKAVSSNGEVVKQVRNWSQNADRYEILNLTHFGTLENRFFVSPFTREHLLKNLEWCQALWAFTKTASLHFTVEDFHAWVHKHDKEYPSLIKFIKDCGTFTVNEEVVRYYEDDDDDCDEDGIYSCECCGDDVYSDDAIWVDGEAYCSDCAFYCEHCQEYRTGDSYMVDDECWCEVCTTDDAVWCKNCRTYSANYIYVDSRDECLCDRCIEGLGIEYCDECGNYTERDDSGRCLDCGEECDDEDDSEGEEVVQQHQEQEHNTQGIYDGLSERVCAELFERCRLISENQPVYTVNTTSGIYTVDSITAPIRNYPI